MRYRLESLLSACFHFALVISLFQFTRTYKTFVTFCRCSYTVCIGEFYRSWSDFFLVEVEQIMWCSSGSMSPDITDFNKADFEQYLFNKNAAIRVR